MLGFQVSDHLFCYRLKSTTENNVLARARANDKRKTNPYLQVCISADKCARRFPHQSKRCRSNSLPLRNETSLDCKNKHCILSERKTLAFNSVEICKCFSLCRDQQQMQNEAKGWILGRNLNKSVCFLLYSLSTKNLLTMKTPSLHHDLFLQ